MEPLERIGRRKAPTPLFRAQAEEWKTVPEEQAVEVMKAQADPVRRLALELLDYGAIRKFELARYIHTILGKKYSRSLIQYHLKLLERAGLVRTVSDPEETKAKLVYKCADVRIQLRSRDLPPKAPRLPDEVVLSLAKKYKGE